MSFIKRHKRIFITLITIGCILMAFFSIFARQKPTIVENLLSYITIPIQKVATKTNSWFYNKMKFLTNIKEIEEQNKVITIENYDLKNEIRRLKQIEVENKKLSELLEIDQRYPQYSKVGAVVIARDTSNWNANFVIDKGSDDGIHRDMVVLSDKGLVGRIIEAGKKYSKVIPIIDDNSAVSAKISRTEELGIVKGDIELISEGLTKMEYINFEAEILEGDEVVTSNLGEIYPEGLLVGYIDSINADENGLTKTAIVKSLVEFNKIESVLIINQTFTKNFIKE